MSNRRFSHATMGEFTANLSRTLKKWLGGGKSPCRRRSSRASRKLNLEQLEDRLAPATLLLLDFDGVTQSENRLARRELHFGDACVDHGESSFVGEFAALEAEYGGYDAFSFLDFNADRHLTVADGELAALEIMARVIQDYAPYDVNVRRVVSTSRALALMSRNRSGDSYIVITGHHEPSTIGGVATLDEEGNPADNLGYVNGSVALARYIAPNFVDGVINAQRAREEFIGSMANFVSHEAAHNFGLKHVDTELHPDALTLATHNQGLANAAFARVTYTTDDGGTQNAHDYLGMVMGRSPNAWAAVLEPGVLTIQGGNRGVNADIQLDADPDRAGDWRVVLKDPSIRAIHLVDPTNVPDLTSLNPYRQAINTIHFEGSDHGDVFRIDPTITARVEAFGNGGGDFLYGGAGFDLLNGGPGRDHLIGGDQDFLDGGQHADDYEIQFANDAARGNLIADIRDTGTLGQDEVVLLGTALPDGVRVWDNNVARFLGNYGIGYPFGLSPVYHTVTYQGVEDLRVRTLDGMDTITVESTTAETPLTLQGGDDDDTFVVRSNPDYPTVDSLLSHLQISGGNGRDTIILDDAGDSTPDQVTVTGNAVGADSGDTFFREGVHLDHRFVERVELYMGNGAVGDTILVAPARHTEFFVHGNIPHPVPPPRDGDFLELLMAGVTGSAFAPGDEPGSGTWSFRNRADVIFKSIERMTPSGDLLPVPIPPKDPLPPSYPIPLPGDPATPGYPPVTYPPMPPSGDPAFPFSSSQMPNTPSGFVGVDQSSNPLPDVLESNAGSGNDSGNVAASPGYTSNGSFFGELFAPIWNPDIGAWDVVPTK